MVGRLLNDEMEEDFGHGLFEVLSLKLPVWTAEKHEEPQSQ
jgi:hypothetical protein